MDKSVTVKFENIGLGNVIWMISSSIGIAKKRNATCYMTENLKPWQNLSGFCGPFPELKPDNLINEYYIHEDSPGIFDENMFTKNYEHTHIRCGKYLQSRRYFRHCDKQIREIFQPNNEYIKKANEWFQCYGLYENTNKVCIHIRGGDMKNDPQIMPSHEWYKNVFSKLPTNCKIIIFSNDFDFVKSIPILNNNNFILAKGNSMMLDFTLMSLCNYFILSRGTFGWWAAYLSNTKEKVYYNNEFLNTEYENQFSEYYPDDWCEIKEKYIKLNSKIDIKPTISDSFDLVNYYFFQSSNNVDIKKICDLCKQANNMWKFNLTGIEGTFKPTTFEDWTILIDNMKKIVIILILGDDSTLDIFRNAKINSKINTKKNNIYMFPSYLSFKCKNVAIFYAVGNTFC